MNQLVTEVWKDVPTWEGMYQASNLGRIKRLSRSIPRPTKGTLNLKDKILKPRVEKRGYLRVSLSRGYNLKHFLVHRLVKFAFEGKKDNLHIDHINGITNDNRIENLRYCTRYENLTFENVRRNKKHLTLTGTKKIIRKKGTMWIAKIKSKNKEIYLGTFNSELEASQAYQERLQYQLKNQKNEKTIY